MRSYKGPIFAHRHYAAIAAVIDQWSATSNDPETIRSRLADMFQRDNQRFDRDRFIAAAIGRPSNGRDKR